MSGFTFGSTPAPSTTPATTFSFGATTATAPTAPTAGAPAPTSTFSFGATTATAPAASTTATSAGGTTTGTAPATTFSFGATPAAAPTTSAVAPTAGAAAPASAFSFGATTANAPAASTTASAAGGGVPSQAQAAPSLFNTAATSSVATGGSGGGNGGLSGGQTAAAACRSDATIPEFEHAFPYVSIHHRVERIIESISDPKNFIERRRNDLILKGHELLRLLSSPAEGQFLSHPQPLTFTPPNTALRQALLPPSPPADHTAHLTFPHQSQPTPVPSPLIRQIIHLSDSLRLNEENAASLYAEVASSSRTSASITSADGGVLDAARVRCRTVRLFHKRQRIGGNVARSVDCTSSSADVAPSEFCGDAVRVAQGNGTYVKGAGEQALGDGVSRTAHELYLYERGYCLRTILFLIRHRITASTVLSSPPQTSSPSTTEDTTTAENHQGWDDGRTLSARIIIEATDALLTSGLLTNLIRLVEDLTNKNEQLAKKIRDALDATDRKKANEAGGGAAAAAATGAVFPTPVPSFGSFGTQGVVPQTSGGTEGVRVDIHDMDYALYEFTFRQRQLAVECLFYLTYHTQCTQDEIVGLIDLIQNLTNGTAAAASTIGGAAATNAGIGTGLPDLDPLKHVGTWMERLEGRSNHNQEHLAGGIFHPSSISQQQQQQQQQKERKHYEWEQDLVTSLCSVRGLTLSTARQARGGADPNSTNRLGGLSQAGNAGTNNVEAVGGGKPQLLRCVTTLMLSVVCALDGKNILIDRNLHGPNSFGVGNALISSDDTSNIQAISERLNPNNPGYLTWIRQDIVGLLSAAFALLLRPAASALNSPRPHHQQPHRSNAQDIKSIFQSCLEVPTITKSLTFARLAMIPCVGTSSMNPPSSDLDSDFSFYMSVLSQFTAQYLDAICLGDLPTSRAKWTQDEEKELQLRQVQEAQKKEVYAWQGQAYEEAPVPTEVDLSKRPDCLDDIIALAVAMCSVCPDCTMTFWSTRHKTIAPALGNGLDAAEEVLQLEPSRIMRNLERVQANDPSLLPAYLSFLSAIALSDAPDGNALARNGATVVHEWLSNTDRATFAPASPVATSSLRDGSNRIDWFYILNAIRWYANELNPPPDDDMGGTNWGSASSFTATEDSTKYYYGDTNDTNYASAQSQSGNDKSSSALADKKNKVLDESSTLTLLSLLNLLSHVALKSDLARASILKTKLTVPGNKRYAPEDDAISILFSLLVTTITPEIRGMTLSTIANLIRCDNNNSLSVEQEGNARRCWEYLEQCQIIPIDVLSQYSTFNGQVDKFAIIASSFVQTAPSSRNKYSNTGSTGDSSWFPTSDQYGIMNEMEHVESKKGSYPSTEGLLRLLTALISTNGCPSDLGSAWRPRPGCAPYIEFVVNFVLPRALGTNGGGDLLHFATLADKARLVTRALEVIDAVVTSYIIPSQHKEVASVPKGDLTRKKNGPKSQPSIRESACNNALSLVRADIFPSKEVKSDNSETLTDFTNENTQIPTNNVLQISSNGFSSNTPTSGMSEEAPRAKSPEFFILSDILSSGGSLFDTLAQILMDEEGPNGINSLYGGNIYSKSVALALFGDTPPDFSLTKNGRDFVPEQQQKYTMPYLQTPATLLTKVTSMMLSLHPPTIQDLAEKPMKCSKRCITSSDDAIFWREHSVLLALRILCAAAGRENKFSSLLSFSPNFVSIVPVLRFRPKSQHGSIMPLDVKNIQVVPLTNQLLGHSRLGRDESLVRLLVKYVGYQSASLADEEDIAAMAISLIGYLCATANSTNYVQALSGLNIYGQAQLAAAMSTRLSMDCKVKSSTEKSIQGVILDLLLKNLDIETVGDDNLSHIILGLSGQSLEAHKKYLQQPSSHQVFVKYGEYSNVLDVVLDLISDINFVINPITSTLAAKCHEIIFRLCSAHDKVETSISKSWLCKTSVLFKLRNMGFWHSQLRLLLLDESFSSKSILGGIVSKSLQENEDNCTNIKTAFRDSNVLHCISWILKGTAVELHALMGFNCPVSRSSSLEGILASTAPQPHQCRALLRLLLDGQSSIILHTLLDLPLFKPLIGLENDSPPREFLQASSKTLEGPVEVCDGYKVIDPVHLQSMMMPTTGTRTEVSVEMEDAIGKWARKWNSYVTFTCASSHLSNAWSNLLRTLLTICDPLIFIDETTTYFDDDQVVDRSSLLWLLKSLLSRLGTDHRVSQPEHNNRSTGTDVVLYNNFEQQGLDRKLEIEPSLALPLSVACFTLARRIFDEVHDTNISFDMDDLVQVSSLAIDAIVCCDAYNSAEDDCHDERAAVLSCTLTAILDFITTNENNFSSHVASSFQSQALRAGIYLSKLSTICNRKNNSEENKNSISRAARSGLASLVSCFDVQNKSLDENDYFLLELFTPGIQNGHSYLSQFIQLLTEFDSGIAVILERIACCSHGTELLVNAGITNGLVSASQNVESSFNSDTVGSDTYGSIEVEPPRFLGGHLSLLNSLLASECQSHTRQQLLCDSVKFIEMNASIGERLLTTYPKYESLTTQFITCVYLLSCGLTGTRNSKVEAINQSANLTTVFNREAIAGLQRRIIDLAFHIGQYPFPSQHLALLPNALREAQKRRINRLRHVDVHLQTDKCWWDSIILEGERVTTLPDPPFGSSDANFLKRNSTGLWSDQKYHIAISGVQCLDLCLLFLSRRAIASSNPLNCDGLALAQVICRMSDSISATNIRLKKLLQSENTELPVMMDLTNIDTGDERVVRGTKVVEMEKNALLTLGPQMGSCVEKLLYLALTEANYFITEAHSTTHECRRMEFVSVLLSALSYTKLESKGVCCVDLNVTTNEAVQQAAKDLRITLEKISRLN